MKEPLTYEEAKIDGANKQIERLCEELSECVSDVIDTSVNVNWMRGSPNLPQYVQAVEQERDELRAKWGECGEILARLNVDHSRVTRENDDLLAKLEKSESSLQFCREWYSCRFERLSKFIREEIPEPQKTRYFSIIANGAADHREPNTYAQQMNTLRYEKEQAESKCAEKTMVIQNLITFGIDGTDPKEVNRAMSDDCGKGILAKVKVLRELLGYVVSELVDATVFDAMDNEKRREILAETGGEK